MTRKLILAAFLVLGVGAAVTGCDDTTEETDA